MLTFGNQHHLENVTIHRVEISLSLTSTLESVVPTTREYNSSSNAISMSSYNLVIQMNKTIHLNYTKYIVEAYTNLHINK